MRRRPHPRRILAIHEAAHACMYMAQGRLVDIVSVHPDDATSEREGFCAPVGAHARIDDIIDVALAGPMAEWHIGQGDDDWDGFLEEFGWQPDIHESIEYAAKLPLVGNEMAGYFHVRNRCDRVAFELRSLWPRVEAVADALLRRRRLDAAQLDRIFTEVTNREVAR